jgi:hypothetical protein
MMLQRTEKWSPDYEEVARKRIRLGKAFEDKSAFADIKKVYASDPVLWINDWVDTYDP